MKRVNSKVFSAVVAAALAMTGVSRADQTLEQSSPAYPTPATSLRTYTGQAGAGFAAGSSDINISALGFFDSHATTTGLSASHIVAVYAAGGFNVPDVLIGYVTVPAGVGTVINGYSFQNVSGSAPLTLEAGQQYVIAGDYDGSSTDTWYDYTQLNWNTNLLAASPMTRNARYGGSDVPADPTSVQGFDAAYGTSNFTGSAIVAANLTAPNWSSSSADLTDGVSSVVIGSGLSGSNNDLSTANVRGVEFSAGAPAMTLTGNGFTLSGAIANYSTSLQTVSTGQIHLNQSFISATNGPLTINSDLDIGNGNGVSAGGVQSSGAYGTQSVNPLVLTGSNTITLAGHLSGSSDLYINNTGNTYLTGDNSNFNNEIVINAGTLHISDPSQLGNATVGISNNVLSSLSLSGSNTYNQTLVFTGRANVEGGAVAQNPALLNSGNNTWAGTIYASGGGNYVIDSGSASDTLTLSGGINYTVAATVYLQGAGNGYLTGGISSNGNQSSFFKLGTGTWTVNSPSGSIYYNGPTRVARGTLIADYNTNNYNNDQISSKGSLYMDGGTFIMMGNDSSPTVQNLTGNTTVASGGGSYIVINNGANATTTLNLNAFTRGNGGTLDISGNGIATTATSNNSAGIIGGWATVNNGASWAINDGSGNIVSLATYTNDAWAAGNNTDVTMSSSPVSGSTTNTVRFNQPAANTLTLSGTNLITGGILVTPNVGNNTTTITGGTLAAVNTSSSQDLIIQQFNTAAPLVISSVIANQPNPASQTGDTTSGTAVVTGLSSTAGLVVGQAVSGTGIASGSTIKSIDSSSQITLSANATATNTTGVALGFTSIAGPLTKAGPGNLTLDAVNTFTGALYLNEGTVSFGLANTLAAENVYPYRDNALDFTPQANGTTIMLGNLGGFGNIDLDQGGNTYNLNFGANNSGVQYDGTISGSGNVIKSGTGQDTWGNTNSFTGTLTISAGRITFKNPSIGGSSITVSDGAEAYINASTTLSQSWTISGGGLSNNAGESALRVGGTSNVVINGAITLTGTAHTALVGADNASALTINSSITGTNTNFGTYSGVAGYIYLNGAVNLGTGTFSAGGETIVNNTMTYSGTTTITSGGDLQIGTGGTTGTLGNTTAAIAIAHSAGVQNNIGYLIIDHSDTVTVPNVISGAGGIMQIGSGTLALTGTNTFYGGVQIQNGVVQANNAASLGNPFNILNQTTGAITTPASPLQFWDNGGTLQTTGSFSSAHPVTLYVNGTIDSDGNNTSLGAVTSVPGATLTKIGAGSTAVASLGTSSLPLNVSINAGTLGVTANGTATGASYLSSLSIGAGAALDLSNNGMLLNYTGTSPLSTVASEITNGYNNGAWNGSSATAGAIVSSAAAQQANHATSLGYMDTGTAVEVKYTWYGDLNLDGVVNNGDLTAMGVIPTTGPEAGLVGWFDGDLNNDGKINSDDWALFMLGNAAQDGSIIAGVPEPTMGALLIAVGALGLRRRRH
ncbi:MAG TPA: autotransporter-associated beta strand repeat-containing protein [Tepidisphaeraceae bacterium]|jgi:autotransporter-associated beta strand protein